MTLWPKNACKYHVKQVNHVIHEKNIEQEEKKHLNKMGDLHSFVVN